MPELVKERANRLINGQIRRDQKNKRTAFQANILISIPSKNLTLLVGPG